MPPGDSMPNSKPWPRPKGIGFLVTLWCIIGGAIGLYLALHWLPWCPLTRLREARPSCELIKLDKYGRVEFILDDDLRWYIGKDSAAGVEAVIRSTSSRINQAVEGVVKQALLEFEIKFGSFFDDADHPDSTPDGSTFDAIRRPFDAGDCRTAAKNLRRCIRDWTADTRRQIGEASLFNLMYQLEQLADLKQSQLAAVDSARIPYKQRIFWVRPGGALAEGIFWSIFGTLTNLILNISHYVARGLYKRDEKYISFSKLAYGPVLSCVLILWIYFGIIDAGVEVRFWLIPLLSFFFGYNTKKTAFLVDTLSDKVFKAVGVSITNLGSGDSTKVVKSAAQNVAASAKPSSLAEVMQMAPTVTQAHITAALISSSKQP